MSLGTSFIVLSGDGSAKVCSHEELQCCVDFCIRATPVDKPQANISLVVGRPKQHPCKFGNPYGVDSGCKIYVALRIPTEANIGV